MRVILCFGGAEGADVEASDSVSSFESSGGRLVLVDARLRFAFFDV